MHRLLVIGGHANDDDANGSAPSPLSAPPSGSSVLASVNVTDNTDSFRTFLTARRLAVKIQIGNRLDFDVRFSATSSTGMAAWKRGWLVLNQKGPSFLGSGGVQLDMVDVRCTEERGYIARLQTLVVMVKSASGLSNQMNVFTLLGHPFDVSPLLEKFGCSGSDFHLKRQTRTVRGSMLAGWQNVEMFLIPPSGPSFLYAGFREVVQLEALSPVEYLIASRLIGGISSLLSDFPIARSIVSLMIAISRSTACPSSPIIAFVMLEDSSVAQLVVFFVRDGVLVDGQRMQLTTNNFI